MIVGIDHALIAVDDLEAAMGTYQRLGFQVVRGGQHPRHGTHNALVPLSDGFYLELMGVWDRSLAGRHPHTNQVVQALDGDNRLALFALDSDDLDADVEAIRGRGLPISDPVPGERERPDGERVAWRTAHPDNPRLPFLIEDVTPRAVRVPEVTDGIGNRLRIARIVIGTQDVEEVSSRFNLLFGSTQEERFLVMSRGTVLVEPASVPYALHRLVLATEGMRDMHELAGTWSESGIPFRDAEPGDGKRILIPKETAGATIHIEFLPR